MRKTFNIILMIGTLAFGLANCARSLEMTKDLETVQVVFTLQAVEE